MNSQLSQCHRRLYQELFGGWNRFEVVWLAIFLIIQVIVFFVQPDSPLATIAAIAGILLAKAKLAIISLA